MGTFRCTALLLGGKRVYGKYVRCMQGMFHVQTGVCDWNLYVIDSLCLGPLRTQPNLDESPQLPVAVTLIMMPAAST